MVSGRDAMRPIAETHGASVARVAPAWLPHQPQVTSVIVGAKRRKQLADNIAATQVALSPDELQRIDDASRLPSEYPGWMLGRQGEYRHKQIADALALKSTAPSRLTNLNLHPRPQLNNAIVGQPEITRHAAGVARHDRKHRFAPMHHAGALGGNDNFADVFGNRSHYTVFMQILAATRRRALGQSCHSLRHSCYLAPERSSRQVRSSFG